LFALRTVWRSVSPRAAPRPCSLISDYFPAHRGETSELTREWPLYGHGNGLFFEAPTISICVGNDADFVLRENMVISIEVFFSRAGVGHAGFENNVIVTATGSELLSRTPMLF
jgi:Xaa-Pro aminopeptidase